MKSASKLIIVLFLASFLVACSSNSPSSNPKVAGDSNSNSADASSAEEIVEISVHYPIGQAPTDYLMIQDAINEITEKEINTRINLIPNDSGDFIQKLTLSLSSNEPIDLVSYQQPIDFHAKAAQGWFMELDDLIDQYGNEIKKVVPGLGLEAMKVSGKIYGVPTIRDFASDSVLIMNADIVEKYNIDYSSVKTLDDLEPIFDIVLENEPDIKPIIPLAPGVSVFEFYKHYDALGGPKLTSVLTDYGAELQVVNYYETPEYKALVERASDWVKKGYIPKGVTTEQIDFITGLLTGQVFSFIMPGKPGVEEQVSRTTGVNVVAISLTEPLTATDNYAMVAWAIGRTSKNPESAMKFMNLLYSNPDIMNLLTWGIEGVHYEKVSENEVRYLEGEDATTVGYQGHAYMFGNQNLTYFYEGSNTNLWNEMDEFNENARFSSAVGFAVDLSPIKAEVAAVNNVINQYSVGLENGAFDPEEVLPDFIQKLKEAGVDKIVAEKQRQLDEWKKAN